MVVSIHPEAAAMHVDDVWEDFYNELDAADDLQIGIEFL